MTTPPLGRYEAREPRVPRTIGAISAALRAGRRAQFFAELLDARRGPELDGVLSVWWGRAMRDTDPARGLPATVEAVALPGRIVRALPVRSTRSARSGGTPGSNEASGSSGAPGSNGAPGADGARPEDGPARAGDRGKARITVDVEAWLGAYAEELVETGRAPSVSAVVNEALAERFRREQRTRRVRAAKTAVTPGAAVRDRADQAAQDGTGATVCGRADLSDLADLSGCDGTGAVARDRSDRTTRDRTDLVTRDRIGRPVVRVEVPSHRPGGSSAGAE
ncbi:hypothetical protein ACIBCT_16155 [Streptosporangium sp. NPDC050855]|uniref:hypothetical protein n=1 Tax=Streptosporangium sp. NPDC050855 TaxID=3366194 RepID=UPI00378AECC2